MIKKVKVDCLRVGVFVHDFNCGWHGSSIYIEPSCIKSENTIEILKNWNIEEVFIDTDRGLDAEPSRSVVEDVSFITPFGVKRHRERPAVPLKNELQSSRKITEDAVKIVEQTYRQAMEGNMPEVGPFYDLAKQMQVSIQRNRDALSLLSRIRKKDEYTLYHSVSVSSHVLNMCHYYEIPEQLSLDIAVGALFHDIGKALVPQTILNKPGKLTEAEFDEMKRHAELSMDMLSKAKNIPLEGYDIALHHHERYDGKGYPHGLEKDRISFAAQVTSVCDVFDAVTSERCYKAGMESVLGLRIIYEGGGGHFNKELANDFIRCIGMYPVGTCVVLADGRSGVVIGSTEDMTRPIVQILYDEKKQKQLTPFTVDLSQTNDTIASYSDTKRLGLTYDQLLRKFLLP
ncbi:MAG: HD-GYP domain-containing protein [Desulfobulbus sp.]|jgi:putative nucleotidyltransferase with HDIG domain|uniref:HD-GYP domain-containing protein n=1 Tax=Desulfobulbus sp. TaxID=895 RepID=UPI00283D6D92|nr:HD-GYP domain-containing protein [Desulfobulbus sp.]MDR2549567.1 HD-GYP domain-containing protein [Desulfobulbus sp.]